MQPLSDRHYHSSIKVDWGRSCDSLHTGANLPPLVQGAGKKMHPKLWSASILDQDWVTPKVRTRCARIHEWTLRGETKNDFAVTWA